MKVRVACGASGAVASARGVGERRGQRRPELEKWWGNVADAEIVRAVARAQARVAHVAQLESRLALAGLVLQAERFLRVRPSCPTPGVPKRRDGAELPQSLLGREPLAQMEGLGQRERTPLRLSSRL